MINLRLNLRASDKSCKKDKIVTFQDNLVDNIEITHQNHITDLFLHFIPKVLGVGLKTIFFNLNFTKIDMT